MTRAVKGRKIGSDLPGRPYTKKPAKPHADKARAPGRCRRPSPVLYEMKEASIWRQGGSRSPDKIGENPLRDPREAEIL